MHHSPSAGWEVLHGFCFAAWVRVEHKISAIEGVYLCYRNWLFNPNELTMTITTWLYCDMIGFKSASSIVTHVLMGGTLVLGERTALCRMSLPRCSPKCKR